MKFISQIIHINREYRSGLGDKVGLLSHPWLGLIQVESQYMLPCFWHLNRDRWSLCQHRGSWVTPLSVSDQPPYRFAQPQSGKRTQWEVSFQWMFHILQNYFSILLRWWISSSILGNWRSMDRKKLKLHHRWSWYYCLRLFKGRVIAYPRRLRLRSSPLEGILSHL